MAIITPGLSAGTTSILQSQWRIDRPRALVRAATRLLLAATLIAACSLLRIDWRLLWLTERLTCLIFALLVSFNAAIALALAFSGTRWLLLVLWATPLYIRLSDEGLSFHAGPFGSHTVPWQSLQIKLDEGLDPDYLDQLPDDSFLPKLIHQSTGQDLIPEILKLARVAPDELTRLLRPLLNAQPTSPAFSSDARH